MKYSVTLSYIPPTESEKELLNERSLGRFLTGAEEDYFLTRVLIISTVRELGLYHFQQCMEKYLKSYLIQNNKTFGGTHDLEVLRKKCAETDAFFIDEDLVNACKQLTPFEVQGRYPSKKVRAYGYVTPDLLYFLDEFVYEMRQRINHNEILDILEEVMNTGKISILDTQNISKSMVETFFMFNEYFKRK